MPLDKLTRVDVYRWETGRRTPTVWLPFIAKALGVDVSALDGTVRTLAELVPRSAALDATRSAAGRRIGASEVSDLMSKVHGLRLADDVLAGRDLIIPAQRELDRAVKLHRESTFTEAVGRQLLIAVGELAQIVGWIASDAGQHQPAEDAYKLGITAAREAADGTLAGNLMGSLAYQWTNIGRESDGLTLAEAAREEAGSDAPPRARALFSDRVAWARTKTAQAQPTIRALGEASDAMDEANGEDSPAWLYWVDRGELQVMEARCFTELHRPLRAVPLLTDVLARYDATHARELALYLSWLAVAYADANEPEAAASTAQRMINLSADVGSDRTQERAKVVLARLAREYADVPEVQEVLGHT
ncbi:transcriptional regulator [Kitasatospora sp. NPDC006697]|uniref:transcriptional regulator n=1 Tax=Kitasatospora sp. NPDC006697 TaxID=3364020 RepID=UPI0036988939